MDVAMRKPTGGCTHVEVTVERGPNAGTWRVSYDPAGPSWRVHSPHRTEHVLGDADPWMGDLGAKLDELMSEIGRRAVVESMRMETSQPPAKLPAKSTAKPAVHAGIA